MADGDDYPRRGRGGQYFLARRACLASEEGRFKVGALYRSHWFASWILFPFRQMSTKKLFPLVFLFGLSAAVFSAAQSPANKPSPVELPAEKRLRNVRQLTNGGENAEAYFSRDGRSLIFQSKRDGAECDQIYTMRADGSDVRMVSTGDGARRPAPTSSPEGSASSTPRRTSARREVPAAARLLARLRLGRLPLLRHLHGEAGRDGRQAPDRRRRATTPRRPSPPTGRRSSSPRCATATSTSTRWTPTGRT